MSAEQARNFGILESSGPAIPNTPEASYAWSTQQLRTEQALESSIVARIIGAVPKGAGVTLIGTYATGGDRLIETLPAGISGHQD